MDSRHSAKAYQTMASMLSRLVDLSSGDGHSSTLSAQVDAEETGLGHRNIFGSEFGAVVMSSFESMAPTLAPEHWGLHGGQKEALPQKSGIFLFEVGSVPKKNDS